MTANSERFKETKLISRVLLEISIIMFLSYAVLLMKEFTKSAVPGKSVTHALGDVFTFATAVIAATSAVIGCIVVEYLRKQNTRS